MNGWDIFDPEKEFQRQVMIYIVTIAAFYEQKFIAKEILLVMFLLLLKEN